MASRIRFSWRAAQALLSVVAVGVLGCGISPPPTLLEDGGTTDDASIVGAGGGSPRADSSLGDAPSERNMQGRDGGSVDEATTDAATPADATEAPDTGPVVECTSGDQRKCKDDPILHALGNCGEGLEVCSSAGHWGACSVQPAAKDSCTTSGDDATCDGNPNNGCPCTNAMTQLCGPAANVGICKRGMQTCVGATWGACMGAVYAAARDCTVATDNDCDGSPDNTVDTVCKCASGGTQACGAHAGNDGKGPCKAGSQTCVIAADKQTSAWGTCTGSVGPAASDTCDSMNDNNCNGTFNDGCACINTKTQSCPVCGTQTCANGAYGACQAPAFAVGEQKWPMPNATAATLHLPNPQDYDTSTSGVVLDKVTGLKWQQNLSTSTYTQAQAVAYCAALSLGGQTGWRLPSVIELVSIADDTQAYDDNGTFHPSIDPVVFPLTPPDDFWSTTPAEGQSAQFWNVSFGTGTAYFDSNTISKLARCVR